MDCRRSPLKTDTETRRRVRSCTGSRSRSLRGKLETFPWAQGGPCDHAEVAGKPRLWPGGKESCESGVSRPRPLSALSEETRDGGSVPLQQWQSFCAIPLRCPGPHKMPLCLLKVQAPQDPGAWGGIAPPEAESAVLLYRIGFGCALLHASSGSHGGRGVIKKTKRVSRSSKIKCRII